VVPGEASTQIGRIAIVSAPSLRHDDGAADDRLGVEDRDLRLVDHRRRHEGAELAGVGEREVPSRTSSGDSVPARARAARSRSAARAPHAERLGRSHDRRRSAPPRRATRRCRDSRRCGACSARLPARRSARRTGSVSTVAAATTGSAVTPSSRRRPRRRRSPPRSMSDRGRRAQGALHVLADRAAHPRQHAGRRVGCTPTTQTTPAPPAAPPLPAPLGAHATVASAATTRSSATPSSAARRTTTANGAPRRQARRVTRRRNRRLALAGRARPPPGREPPGRTPDRFHHRDHRADLHRLTDRDDPLVMRPAAGAGTSESTLSLDTSQIASSGSTRSPGCCVPAHERPLGDGDAELGHHDLQQALAAGHLSRRGAHGRRPGCAPRPAGGALERRRERDRGVRRGDAHDRPVEVAVAVLRDQRATWAPGAHV